MEELEKVLKRIKQEKNGVLDNIRKINGILGDSEEIRCDCPKCGGTGFKEVKIDGYDFMAECECGLIERRRMRNRIKFADIPDSFKEIRLSSFDKNIYIKEESKEKIEKAIKIVQYWLDNLDEMLENGIGLYLYSFAKGSGKTRMAASIANELIYEKKIQVKFATSIQILNEIKSTWNGENDKGYTESKLLDLLSTTKVLVIDDFNTENSSSKAKSWIEEKFYHILNTRYQDRKITIITSNNDIKTLGYGSRIISRLTERSIQVPFPEEDIRVILGTINNNIVNFL